MSDAAVVDTSFLICLVSAGRQGHEAAKSYYKYFLEHDIALLLPTIVVAEFCLKQPITDLPLHNFRVLPFNVADAQLCAELNVSYYRQIAGQQGQRDAVKDDFKIIAQAVAQQARYLVTEDDDTLVKYCAALRADGKVAFEAVPLSHGFDEARVNGTGQRGLGL